MKENTNNVQDAISDLAALRPNWSLLADTLPDEFLRQVKGEIESLSAEASELRDQVEALTAQLDEVTSNSHDRHMALVDNLHALELAVKERDALKARVELLEAYARADATSALYVGTERDALAEQLAALKQRIVDAGKTEARWFGDFDVDVFVVNCIVPEGGTYALVRLENGE